GEGRREIHRRVERNGDFAAKSKTSRMIRRSLMGGLQEPAFGLEAAEGGRFDGGHCKLSGFRQFPRHLGWLWNRRREIVVRSGHSRAPALFQAEVGDTIRRECARPSPRPCRLTRGSRL